MLLHADVLRGLGTSANYFWQLAISYRSNAIGSNRLAILLSRAIRGGRTS